MQEMETILLSSRSVLERLWASMRYRYGLLTTYGEVNLGDAVIELSEADAPVDDVQGLSGAVLVVLGVGVLLAAGLVIALLMRSNDGEDGKNDRFGMQ